MSRRTGAPVRGPQPSRPSHRLPDPHLPPPWTRGGCSPRESGTILSRGSLQDCFVVLFLTISSTRLSVISPGRAQSLTKSEYALAQRRRGGKASENQSSIKCVCSVSWAHPILIAPRNVCQHQRRGREGKGLSLPRQMIISNRWDQHGAHTF